MTLEPIKNLTADFQPPEQMRLLAEIYGELGHTLSSQNRYSEAAQAFRQAISEKPECAELEIYLAQALEAQGKCDGALRAYLEAVRLSPAYALSILPKAHSLLTRDLAKALRAWLNSVWRDELEKSNLDKGTHYAVSAFLGRVGLYCEEYHQARIDYEKAESVREDVFSLEGLGEALWHDGQPEQAADKLVQAVSLADQCNLPDRRSTTRYRLARVLMVLGKYEQAILVASNGLELKEPSYTIKFQVLLSQCYQALEQTDQALSIADAVLAQDGNQVEALAVRAAALYKEKQYKAAAKSAEDALKLVPTHLEAIRIRALALLDDELKDKTQALLLLQVYLRQRPADLDLQRRLIRGLRETQRPISEVIEALNSAIVKAPSKERPALMLELAESYLQGNKPTSAIELLKQVVDLNLDLQTAHWWQLYGDAQSLCESLDDALSSYEHGLALEPEDRELLEHYEKVLHHIDNWPRAAKGWQRVVAGWQRLIKVAPDDSRAHLSLAYSLEQVGNFNAALETLETALMLDSDYAVKAEGFGLKANLLRELNRSEQECAEAFFEAGRNLYWDNKVDDAIRMFESAKQLNDQHLPTYWYLADALLSKSYRPDSPYVYPDKVDNSLQVWNAGFNLAHRRIGDPNYSWAYTTRARIDERQARLHGQQSLILLWEGVAYLEQAILLRPSDESSRSTLACFHRLLENETIALYVSSKALELNPQNLGALDERAAILANTGDYKQAMRVIEERLKLASDAWLSGVKAYVLLLQGEYSGALESINRAVQGGSDDLWSRNLRAICYRMLDRPSSAREDYEWIWERVENPNFAGIDNRNTFGWAAYGLSILRPDPSLLDKAIGIFEQLYQLNDPMRRVSSDLGKCFLTRGDTALNDIEKGKQLLIEGVERAINTRELDEMLQIDFVDLERSLRDRPYGAQVHGILQEVTRVLSRRHDVLAAQQPRSTQEELTLAEQLLLDITTNPDRKGPTDGWARVGAQAGLARLHGEQERWREAAVAYQRLLEESEQPTTIPATFSEARFGLEKAVDNLRAIGDACLKGGKPEEALKQYTQALDQVSVTEDKKLQAGLYGRMGYVHFGMADLGNARMCFSEALRLFREAGEPDSGEALGSICCPLLPDVPGYWALDSGWQAFAGDPQTSGEVRQALMAARRSLRAYLGGVFSLGPHAESAYEMLPLVTPIIVEMGKDLVPKDSGPDWPLLKEHLPEMRKRLKQEMGVDVPGVRVRLNEDLPSYDYTIMLDEVPVEKGTLMPGQPDCELDMVRDIEAILRPHLDSFVGVQETANLLERWGSEDKESKLIVEVVPDATAQLRFGRLLRALLAEGVSIAPWRKILEAVRATGLPREDVHEVVRAARLRLKECLPGNYCRPQPATRVPVPQYFELGVSRGILWQDGIPYLDIRPEETQKLMDEIRDFLKDYEQDVVLIAHDATVRPFVRQLVALEFPKVYVIAEEELLPQDAKVA